MSIKLSVERLLAGAQKQLIERTAELDRVRAEYQKYAESYEADTLQRWRDLAATISNAQAALGQAAAYINNHPDDPDWERLRETAKDALNFSWYSWYNLAPTETPDRVYKQQVEGLEAQIRYIQADIALFTAVHGPSITMTYDNQRLKRYIE